MGARVRAFDWEKTPLGPISSWPQSLKTTIDLMMASQLAMNLIWGPERILIYNEVHRAFMGTKHPRAFGRPGREVWGEVWEAAEAIHHRVFAARPLRWKTIPGRSSATAVLRKRFFTSYFTPIRDETGAVVANLALPLRTPRRKRVTGDGWRERSRLAPTLATTAPVSSRMGVKYDVKNASSGPPLRWSVQEWSSSVTVSPAKTRWWIASAASHTSPQTSRPVGRRHEDASSP